MTTLTPARELPPENLVRGTLFALLAVPIGVVLWVVIWSFGFVSAIAAFAVAAAAAWLYRKGSGGRVSTKGAVLISVVVLVTLLLSFYCGLVTDYVRAIADEADLTWIQAFTHPLFWTAFGEDFGALLKANAVVLILSLALGVLGAFSVLRVAFAASKQPAGIAPTIQEPLSPTAPSAPQVNPGSSGTLNGGADQPDTI